MINFLKSVFDPVFDWFDLMIDRINTLGTIAVKGVRLDDYFGFFAILGPSWSGVITYLISCLIFLLVLYVLQKQSRLILWFKDVIKWW